MTKKMTEKIIAVPQLECKTAAEVLQFLGEKLVQEKLVVHEYIEAVLEREKTYPTALPSESPRIAIPHADYNLVNKTSIAIATLKNPVIFYNMEQVDEPLDVQIVILLAVAEPHGQIEMLQKVIAIIQDRELCQRLLKCETEEELLLMVEPIFEQ